MESKHPEIALVAEGAVVDLAGSDPRLVDPARVDEIVAALPRRRFKHNYQRVFAEQARRRPVMTTFANFLGEVGERYVPGFTALSLCDTIDGAPYAE